MLTLRLKWSAQLHKILFWTAKSDWSARVEQEVVRALEAEINWPVFLMQARYYRIAPLLYHNILRYGLKERFPPQVVRELKDEYVETHSINLAYYNELKGVLSLLQEAGIQYRLLKGAALGLDLFPDPGLRPFGDIDLLLHEGDIERAEGLLRDYERQTPRSPSPFIRGCYFHYHYRKRQAPPLALELHWKLFSPTLPLELDLDFFWTPCRRLGFMGHSFDLPSREALFFHLCLHYSGHYFLAWRDLWDLERFLAPENAPEWELVVEMALRCGLQYRIYFPLLWAQQLLMAGPPHFVMERLRPSPAGQKLFLNLFEREGGIVSEPVKQKRDLRAAVDLLLLAPGRRLGFCRRLCLPGIAWLTIFPDTPRAGGLLKRIIVALRGLRLLCCTWWALLRARG